MQMLHKLEQFFLYFCFVGIPLIMGYAFTLLIGFGLSTQTAAILFFGIALSNTVRFSLSPQTTHWLPKCMANYSAAEAAAGLKNVVLFELAAAAFIFTIFLVVIFLFTRIDDSYTFSSLLPFGIFVFSNVIPLFSTLQRQWVSITLPAIYKTLYWLGRVGLVAAFVILEIPESSFILALVCFEATAYFFALALIFRLLRILGRSPYDGPAPHFLNFSTIRNMLGRSILRGSLRDIDILCAGLIGNPNVLVEYRIIRSLAFAMNRGLTPAVDMAFVGLSKLKAETVSKIWLRQRQIVIWTFGLVILATIPLAVFGSTWIEALIARLLRLEEPGLSASFLLLLLAGLLQVICIALYPLAMQYKLHSLVFLSGLGGAVIFIPMLIVSVQIQMITFLAASYLAYTFTILTINFLGVKRHARQPKNTT